MKNNRIFAINCFCTISVSGSRCEMCPGFFISKPISHFWACFSAFSGSGGITYHPDNKSVLNRISEKINFFL